MIKSIGDCVVSFDAMKGDLKYWIGMMSGWFDPLHSGHIKMFKDAVSNNERYLDYLVIVVNDDDFLIRKKWYKFMELEDRMRMVNAVCGCLNETRIIITTIKGDNMKKALEILEPRYFMNGGDRNKDNIAEREICEKLWIEMVDNIWWWKEDSSSDIVWKFMERYWFSL